MLIDNILTNIAKTHMGIKTLETQNSDQMDFHEICVWDLKKALSDAYIAGSNAKINACITPQDYEDIRNKIPNFISDFVLADIVCTVQNKIKQS